MNTSRSPWIWQHPGWPKMTFDMNVAAPALLDARQKQGEVVGKSLVIGFDKACEVSREVMIQEVVATAAIEGEALDPASVRSSIMHQLGLADGGHRERHVDGLVEVINDATNNFAVPLDADRLCRWQSALFPGGTRGIHRIAVGRFRDHDDPMQIVSGRPGKEVIHYQAPASSDVPNEMDAFLAWFEVTNPARAAESPGATRIDGIARAAIAHLWFESIHPFEDGNGRIGRAIVDMAIAQDQKRPVRLFSLSSQLSDSRRHYYDALNHAQRGTGDVTQWVAWFANQFSAACNRTSLVIDQAIKKSQFWSENAQVEINPRQRRVLQRLLDDGDGGYLGGLNADKYMKMTGASKATASRDLADLVASKLLWAHGLGKAVRYYIAVPGWTHGVDRGTASTPMDMPLSPSLGGGILTPTGIPMRTLTSEDLDSAKTSPRIKQRPRRP
ncbi:Fic family protein [Paucibacter soli]|uniref:Fic family protein n=1 Tax=Paucibacter soli TaxID=3133433 RepID=UPI0030B0D53C